MRVWLVVVVVVVGSAANARGDGPAQGFLVQPVVETQAATIAVGNGGAVFAGSVVGPTLRLGYQVPRVRATADLRYGALVSVNDGDVQGQHAFTVGATVVPTVWTSKRGCSRLGVLGGFNVGTLIDQAPQGDRDAYLSGGFTLGATLDQYWKRRAGIGLELGVQTQFTRFPGELATTVGIHIGVGGLFFPKLGGGNDPADDCQGEPPPVVVAPPPPTGTTVTCGPSHPCDVPPPCEGLDDLRLCFPEIKPPPTTYGEEIDNSCKAELVDGWFEPTQGVFQDDEKFGDKVAALYRTPTGIVYYGNLNMVRGRHTVFTGVNWYIQNKQKKTIDARSSIVMKGKSTCKEHVPVKLQFTVFEKGAPRVVHTTNVIGTVPLRGGPRANGKEVEWTADINAQWGLPRDPETFTFNATGPFWIEAQLLDLDNRPTGMKMLYFGQVQDTTAPKLTFYPIFTKPETTPGRPLLMALTAQAAQLVGNSIAKIPDWFPIRPRSVDARLGPALDFIPIDDYWFVDAAVAIKDFFTLTFASDKLGAQLIDRLQTTSALTGAGRVVGVMSRADYEEVLPGDSAAITPTTKTIFIKADRDVGTVAHEFLHTTPQYIFSKNQMIAECGHSYHNTDEDEASGLRVTRDSVPTTMRRLWDKGSEAPAIMGPSLAEEYKWITQCSYVHLLRNLNALVDPPMILVRALLIRKGDDVQAAFGPSYDLMSEEELKPGSGGEWAFVLKDATGKSLGRFPFAFTWEVADGRERNAKPIAHRLPSVPGVATIELVRRDRVLATMQRSATAPTLALRGVTDGALAKVTNGRVALSWTAQVEANRRAYTTLLYSSDAGKNWDPVVFETKKATSADVVLKAGVKDHRVKLIVSDGTRSTEQIVRFTTK